MPADTALEDDYIISLLRQDADDHQKRYSTIGDSPRLSTAKRRPDAPKPNTRFLKNIIRETEGHNAALKAKEEADSKARLQERRREEARGGKRKRAVEAEGGDGGGERAGKRRKEEGRERKGRWASALGLNGANGLKPRKGRDENERREPRWRLDVEEVGEDRSMHRHRHHGERSHASDRTHRERHGSRQSRSKHRSRSPDHRKEHRRHLGHRLRSKSPAPDLLKASESDSDPLAEFVGPFPPSQSEAVPRGRGALKPSGIDSRFHKDYNPTTDLALNHDEEDDWDMALEALQARTKWRTQGAERLRAAGFTDEEVERWERSGSGKGGQGDEKDVQDVRWSKKGEGREWDRGKVVDEEGEGELGAKAEWAR